MMTWNPTARLVITVALCCAPTWLLEAQQSSEAGHPEILWDTYGVPHIFAANRYDLAFAFGWAQMRNHGDLALRLVAQARGRASEYLGPSYVDEDRWVRTLGIPRRATAWYAAQPPAMREHLRGFVDGMNACARAHPELMGDSVRAILPLTPADVLAHHERFYYSAFLTSRFAVEQLAAPWRERGSNAWAIAPRRSASGHAMLLANPHLPWSDLFTWTEAQYVMPGVDVYGGALVLAPVIQIGFNDDLGWTHTVNTQDGADLFEITLAPRGYRWNGGVRPFHEETEVMQVRQPDGTLRPDTLHIRRTVQGPVVAVGPARVLALRAVGIAGPSLPYAFVQWWAMGASRNFAGFMRAVRPNQLSGFNIIYADRAGHIMMAYGGNTPVRELGDRHFWDGIVPGDRTETLWQRLLSFAALPRVVDPPSGWVQNANDPPWWATFPPTIRATDYPAYLATREMLLRPQRSVRLLAGDSSISFDAMVRAKHSTRLELADRVLDELVADARTANDSLARQAADVLDRWDRNTDAGSRGAVLFTSWWDAYLHRLPANASAWREVWRDDAPRSTPRGLAAPDLAVQALDSAALSVRARYARIDVPWGDVYRLRRDGVDLPSNGASGLYGAFRVQNYIEAADHRFVAGAGGDSFVAAVEFSTPLRAMTIVPYGNASRAGSPHRTDQLGLYADQRLKPAWRTRAEIASHVELREQLESRPRH